MNRGARWASVHGVAKSRTQLSNFTFAFHFRALEKEMATHPSVLAWRIPGTGEPGRLPSMGSHRVGHDWSDLAAAVRHLPWQKLWWLRSRDGLVQYLGNSTNSTDSEIRSEYKLQLALHLYRFCICRVNQLGIKKFGKKKILGSKIQNLNSSCTGS